MLISVIMRSKSENRSKILYRILIKKQRSPRFKTVSMNMGQFHCEYIILKICKTFMKQNRMRCSDSFLSSCV